ncbi:MAG: ATP-binding protein [Acidobacteriota bacterium]
MFSSRSDALPAAAREAVHRQAPEALGELQSLEEAWREREPPPYLLAEAAELALSARVYPLAASWAERCADGASTPDERAAASVVLAAVALRRDRREDCERLLASLDIDGLPAEFAALTHLLQAGSERVSGRPAESLLHADRAREVAWRAGRPDLVLQAELDRCEAALQQQATGGVHRDCLAVLAQARELGLPWDEARAHLTMAVIWNAGGDRMRAIESLWQARALAVRSNCQGLLPSILLTLASAYAQAGRPLEGLALVEEARTRQAREGDPLPLPVSANIVARLLIAAERYEEALEVVSDERAEASPFVSSKAMEGMALAGLGRDEEALEALSVAVERFLEMEANGPAIRVMIRAARILLDRPELRFRPDQPPGPSPVLARALELPLLDLDARLEVLTLLLQHRLQGGPDEEASRLLEQLCRLRVDRDTERLSQRLDDLQQRFATSASPLELTLRRSQADEEEDESSRRGQSEQLARLVHDLQNPLTSVLLLADELREQVDNRTTSQAVEELHESADLLRQRVDNLVSRIGSELVRDDRHDAADLVQVVDEVLQASEASRRCKRQVLTWVDRPDPLPVRGKEAVRSIVEGLVSNASKFTPFGGRITVRVTKVKGMVHLEVEDDGPGLSDGDLERVFAWRARMTAQPTAGEPTVGVGLALARAAARELGGSLEAANGELGAIFRLALPLVLA